MPEPAGPSAPLSAAKSLPNAQYDAWLVRTMLISCEFRTSSFPGDVVFTGDSGGPDSLAFAQLGSSGTTYSGMALAKSPRDTWLVLERSGIPVPQWRAFGMDAAGKAEGLAARLGYPVALSAMDGSHRRIVDRPEQVRDTFTELQHAGEHRTLLSEISPGPTVRVLVCRQQVLAVMGEGRRDRIEPERISHYALGLAVTTMQALPGLDLGGVSMVIREPGSNGEQEPLITGVTHYPHLRDFSAGSRNRALELAQALVESEAWHQGLELPEPQAPIRVCVDFSGVPDPEELAAGMKGLLDELSSVDQQSPAEIGSESLRLTLSGEPVAIALLITCALNGLEGGTSAQLAATTPV